MVEIKNTSLTKRCLIIHSSTLVFSDEIWENVAKLNADGSTFKNKK